MKDFFLENFNSISAGFAIATLASSKFISENIDVESTEEQPKKSSFLKTALKTAGVLGAGALVGSSLVHPDGFSGVMNNIGSSFQSVAPTVSDKITSVGNSIGSTMQSAGNSIATGANKALNSTGDAIKSFGNSAQQMGQNAMNSVKNIAPQQSTTTPPMQASITTPVAPTPKIDPTNQPAPTLKTPPPIIDNNSGEKSFKSSLTV